MLKVVNIVKQFFRNYTRQKDKRIPVVSEQPQSGRLKLCIDEKGNTCYKSGIIEVHFEGMEGQIMSEQQLRILEESIKNIRITHDK